MTEPVGGNTGFDTDIAIVGMSAHLPGARDINEYWTNLRDGVESIRRLSEEELQAAGENPSRMRHKNYVPSASILDDFEQFDADFFGFSPKESAIMDPQHRQFLEVAWEALENAGHPPENFPGLIGVYAGCGMGSYFYFNICSNPDLVDSVGMFLLRHTGNDKDFLSTRVSHIFNLQGPSINVQTACSTSLVATHYACQALLNGECDMALAGGVTIELPHKRGYIFEEGEILSPDGHCHAFDHRAQGTVFGSGAGAVVLRRLSDAIADGDHIWGVIKGTAVNNDGSDKAGYLAPSVEGQARAIAEAHAIAGITADTIDYVECHGTGTYLGDPIEVAALTSAFQETTDETGFCRIGSVKTNIGHLDTAAGVASLIKATLALKHRQLPPSLGFEAPNPAIDFENSPFSVNAALRDFTSHKGPRRAAVNSLGVGGTNAHAVIEEAPERAASEESDWPFQILTVSGRSRAALDANTKTLAAHLRAHPEQPLADVAYTLKEGRRAFEKRRVVVVEDHEEAADLLEEADPRRVFTHSFVADDPEVVFMFPGGGAQFAGMARDLYETEPVFQEWMDKGLDILQPKLDYDIRALWLPEAGEVEAADEKLKKPSVQLPLIMITEYALAQLWMSWNVAPAAFVGHSMGENTAACLAGVMSFEDCIGLVHLRGTLMDSVPKGGMLSLPLPLADVKPLLGDDLDIASVNAPELTVVSGPQAALDKLQAEMEAKEVECQRVPIDIAAHSRMLEPILQPFRDYLNSINLNPLQIPIASNYTGALLTDGEATDPEYWVSHLRNTVRFADCITTLAQEPERIYLEVGPGKALSSLAQAHGAIPANQVMSSLRHPKQVIADDAYFLSVVGRLWAVGVNVDWEPIWGDAKRQRVPLPTYAFQRAPYFIEPGKGAVEAGSTLLTRNEDIADWGYQPTWRPRLADCDIDVEFALDTAEKHTWLVFSDDAGVATRSVKRLRSVGHTVIEVFTGDAFTRSGDHQYFLAPERGREGYEQLMQDLVQRGMVPNRIAHFWLVTAKESFRPGSSFFHRNVEQGFYSLLFLAQAISDENLPTPLHISIFTSGAAQVRDEALPYPEKATIMGPAKVIPRELPKVTCSVLDITMPSMDADRGLSFRSAKGPSERSKQLETMTDRVLEEMLASPGNTVAALRGTKRFGQDFRAISLTETIPNPYQTHTTFLLTGGFGGIGLTIAEHLVRKAKARIVLLSRTGLPERGAWDEHLKGHGPFDAISKRIRAVQRLEALGGEVMVAEADVCNVSEMKRAIASVEEKFGKINGLIHAAGVVNDGPLLAKSPDTIEDVFTPKIHGTQVLDNLFPDGSLDLMVLFSSTSTIIAPAGQVDYVAANEYLNAFAKSRRNGKTKVVAINWGIWNEVGMAAAMQAERRGEIPDAPAVPIEAPLLDTATFDSEGNRVFEASYSTADRWIFDGHRTKGGDALMPGTGYIELAAEALQAHGEKAQFEIRDLLFLRPLQVVDGVETEVRVRLKRNEAGYAFEVRSACTVQGKKGFQLHAQATIAILPQKTPDPLDIASIRAAATVRSVPDDPSGIRSPQEEHLNFGARWRVLREMDLGANDGVARLRLPDAFSDDLKAGYRAHPALLDLATGWAMDLIEGYEARHLWVPVSYESVRFFKPLPQEIYSHVRSASENRHDHPFAAFDVTLTDGQGEVCLEIRNFSIHRLETATSFTKAPPLSVGEVEFERNSDEAAPLSASEERFQAMLEQGIRPEEGADAFARAISTGLSQVIVTSMDLDALVAQAAEGGQAEEGDGQKFERPQLDSEYVEPSNDIERTLVGFWEDLLGVSNVGVEDSFFDLGGHSLIAVRLFAMVKKAFRVEFPISILFEAPTISKCAALIMERTGLTGQTDGGETKAQPTTPTRRFTHIVPMHSGEGGPKTPFFLVAGMFGNVLNLRHLAHLLGSDRPFYGLQARGLYGNEEPHTSLVDAARDYIAEMQEVQPHGPYMLGGFSGGGITAYEIAHQLEAAGETVSLVVMLDTPLPVRTPLSAVDRVMIQLQEIRRKGLTYPYTWARNRIRWELAKRRANDPGEHSTPEHQFHNADIEAAFMTSVTSYPLKGWDGPLKLFRPPLVGHWDVSGGKMVDSQRAYVLHDNGWTDWVPTVEVFEVPGDHDSMVLEPNVRVLASGIKECIQQAEAKHLSEAASLPNATAAE
ncbi:type I polyketide synthase [Algicella marina]|uniref:Phenolphthiocerol/phthiocerol polyketide synthase subunit E n=1 Tax=Algicella marina TaxID=2683284 RepID=A0A6P1SY02_9RHOB|nr:type I polyketide synthase [Algicella marina]QHQ34096.1 SDR family NAD(P)-dependent oxidoreductase [Algicella marina]